MPDGTNSGQENWPTRDQALQGAPIGRRQYLKDFLIPQVRKDVALVAGTYIAATGLTGCAPVPGENQIRSTEAPTLTSEELKKSFEAGEPEVTDVPVDSANQEAERQRALERLAKAKEFMGQALDWINSQDNEKELVTQEVRQKIIESVRTISRENWLNYVQGGDDSQGVPLGAVYTLPGGLIDTLIRDDVLDMEESERMEVFIHEAVHGFTSINAERIIGGEVTRKPMVSKELFLVNGELYFMDLHQGIGVIDLNNGDIDYLSNATEYTASLVDLAYQFGMKRDWSMVRDSYGLIREVGIFSEYNKKMIERMAEPINLRWLLRALVDQADPITAFLDVLGTFIKAVDFPPKAGFLQGSFVAKLDAFRDLVKSIRWIKVYSGKIDGVNLDSTNDQIREAINRFYLVNDIVKDPADF